MDKNIKMRVALSVLALTLPVAGNAVTAPAEAPSAEAVGVDDPVAFITSFYKQYGRDGANAPDPTYAYSPELKALIETDRKENEGMAPRLDFDFWSNSQDPDVHNVRVKEEKAPTGKRYVVARFKLSTRPIALRFQFIPAGKKWFLDDVEQIGGAKDNYWRLRTILTGPQG